MSLRNPRAMLGMHDGAAVFERRKAMRAAFVEQACAPCGPLPERLQEAHARNVELFGWRDAEVIRAEAFAEAVQSMIPFGEAVDSDFGAFNAAALP